MSEKAADLSADLARRIVLAAQGFGARRSAALSRGPAVAASIARMGLLQLDSVNVLLRSHYWPVYSRIGPYDRAALDRAAFEGGRQRAYFEYWAHEASILPLALYPLMGWRMRRAARGLGLYAGLQRFASENGAYIDAVLDEIRQRGPLAASQLADPGARSGPWWGWHKGKTALEYLFWTGAVTAGGRRAFERLYDLPERVLPASILNAPPVEEPEALRTLLGIAADALGVATEVDLRDYFRLPPVEARKALGELVEEGRLRPLTVEGWTHPAYLAASAAPSTGGGTALLSPFDPLVWHRPRAERIFDFHYRLEFYTPGDKRVFGYFVMPFLYRGRLAGRVDLKADRAASVLRVPGAFLEHWVRRPDPVLAALAEELRMLCAWIGLEDIAVSGGSAVDRALSARLLDQQPS